MAAKIRNYKALAADVQNYGGPATEVYIGGGEPAASAPPSSGYFQRPGTALRELPGKRGFSMRPNSPPLQTPVNSGGGWFQMSGSSATEVPVNPRNLPAVQGNLPATTNMNRGWTMGRSTPLEAPTAPPRTIEVPATSIPKQIGFTPQAAPLRAGAGLAEDAMGVGLRDSVVGAGSQAATTAGKGGVLRAFGRGAGAVLSHPLAQTAMVLGPVAQAQSAATSDADRARAGQGVQRVDGTQVNPFDARGVSFGSPGRSFAAGAVSSTDPYTGAPVSVTQANPTSPHPTTSLTPQASHTSAPVPPEAPAPAAPPTGDYNLNKVMFRANEGNAPEKGTGWLRVENGSAKGATGVIGADGNVVHDATWDKTVGAENRASGTGTVNTIAARDERAESDFNPDGTPKKPASSGLKTAQDFAPAFGGDLRGLNFIKAQKMADEANAVAVAAQRSQAEMLKTQAEIGGIGATANYHNAAAGALGRKTEDLEKKLAMTESLQAQKDAAAAEKVKAITDDKARHDIYTDPTERAKLAAVGGDLDAYNALNNMGMAQGLTFKPTPFKSGFPMFRKTNPGGWYTSEDKLVPTDQLIALHRKNQQKLAQ